MGSIIDYPECPRCKTEAFSDYYYRTGEEFVYCGNCGYQHRVSIKNKDKKLTELEESDWEIQEEKEPYGAYRYACTGDVGTSCGTLVTEQDAADFRTRMRLNDKGMIQSAQISRFVDGEIVVEDII